MNGAKALPSVKTINEANKSKKNKIGASQYFFRTRRNCQNSRIISAFAIIFLSLKINN